MDTGGNTERCLTDDIRRALEGARKVFLVLPSATSSKRTNNISPKPMRFKTGKRSRLFRCECPVCTNAVCAVAALMPLPLLVLMSSVFGIVLQLFG